ncbi:MAG: glycosyltransferase family 2 protein [Bacteroidota bacterium]
MLLAIAVVHGLFLLTLLMNLVFVRSYRGRAGSPQPSVTVLIPARNEETNLGRLLPSLAEQNYPNFDVLVYDDGSEDGTWDVIQQHASQDAGGAQIRGLKGSGPAPGWVGKVHALYQATRHATGDVWMFLDADTKLADPDALSRLVARFHALPENSVLTGFNQLRGGGLMLVSLVPYVLISSLPWPLVRWLPLRSLGAVNGQFWMVRRRHYQELEPHEAHKDEVLEDVMIGRYFQANGIHPYMLDVQNEISVWMYTSFSDAWQGFRKNAYLLLGGTVISFVLLFTMFVSVWVAGPWLSWWFLGALYLGKFITDRFGRFPFWLTLLAPVSFALAAVLQFDSALAHWTGRVKWKGRTV